MDKNKLTDVELVIMQVIWDSTHELQLGEILPIANERTGNDWKRQTVSTYLSRLVQKGFLEMENTGRFSTYRPLIDRETYMNREMASFADKWGDHSLLGFAVSYHKSQPITQEQKEALMEFLEGLDD